MSTRKYSLYTLRPISVEDRSEFWTFRIEDMVSMFKFYIALDAICLLILSVLYMQGLKWIGLSQLVFELIALILHLMVWAIRDRYRKAMVFVIPTMFAVTTLFHTVELWMWMRQSDEGLNMQIASIIYESELMLSCILLAPSMLYVGLYQAIFGSIMVLVLFTFEQSDMDSSQLHEFFLQTFFSCIGLLIVAYALQTRELNRFYEKKKHANFVDQFKAMMN